MRRVLVIGSGGSGKSTLAGRIGECLGLPVIHLDSLYWKAGWVETPEDEWQHTVRSLVSKEAWVMDGNYGGTLDLRLAAADAVIFLDLPRLLCVWRVIRRRVAYRGKSRPDMSMGCPERLDWEFIYWIWTYRRVRRPGILEKLSKASAARQIFILQSQAAVRDFVKTVCRTPPSERLQLTAREDARSG